MSMYPPGVTGNEYPIAGPDYEKEVDEKCQVCGSPQMEQGYRGERWLVCSDGHEWGLEPIEPDPDRKRDEDMVDEAFYALAEDVLEALDRRPDGIH